MISKILFRYNAQKHHHLALLAYELNVKSNLTLLVPKVDLSGLLKSAVECPGFALAVECKMPQRLKQNTQLQKIPCK